MSRMDNYSRYFAISPEDKAWGLYLLTCGSSCIEKGTHFPRRDHPAHHYFTWRRGRTLSEYQLVYLVQGAGTLETQASGPHALEAGMVFMLFPGVWHRYKPLPDHPWQTFWIGFQGAYAERVLARFCLTPEQPLQHIGHRQPLVHLFRQMLETSRREFPGYQQVMAGDVLKLLGWLHAWNRMQGFQGADTEELIQRAKLMLMNCPMETSMQDIAASLSMSYSRFRKLFSRYTGLSPKQYQGQLRISTAIHLLQDESRSIKEVAAETGFESPYYFSRFFKQKTGQAPQAYRQQLWRTSSDSQASPPKLGEADPKRHGDSGN